jgi:hypothetical protein
MLLVWFGARPVLHNAVFGTPPALPLAVSRTPTSSVSPSAESGPPLVARSLTPVHSPKPVTASPSADNRTYLLTGGRVVLCVTATSVRLISATPDRGYEVRIWRGDGWLRVDFHREGRTSSLFATWNGHPPSVRVAD